jgi:hypothetical protein
LTGLFDGIRTYVQRRIGRRLTRVSDQHLEAGFVLCYDLRLNEWLGLVQSNVKSFVAAEFDNGLQELGKRFSADKIANV